MIEQRGMHRKKLADKNEKAVRKWVDKNPLGTMKKCQDDLKLSHVTVRKYVKMIIKELKKDGWFEAK